MFWNLFIQSLLKLEHKLKKKIVLRNYQSPGDILMLTVVIRELAIKYSDKFIIDARTTYPEITFNNPYLTHIDNNDPEVEFINMSYTEEMQSASETGNHFSDGFISFLNDYLNLNIKKTSMFPDIFLTDDEKDREKVLSKYGIDPNEKFWMFNAGFKVDMPLKAWIPEYWQETIDLLNMYNIPIYQVGSTDHIHHEFTK